VCTLTPLRSIVDEALAETAAPHVLRYREYAAEPQGV
jgi:hypothetical protein